MPFEQVEQEIVAAIQRPQIPHRTVTITDYGAVADVPQAQTEAIQRVIDALASSGGGRVVVPAGTFVCGALELRSQIELHLSARESRLAFLPCTARGAYPLRLSYWEGSPCYNYSSMLYARDCHDVAVTGCGSLDGGACAENWWCWHRQVEEAWASAGIDLQSKARLALRRMNEEGVPVQARVFGDGAYLRPDLLQLIGCDRVLLAGVTLLSSPMWVVHPVLCTSVTLRGVEIRSYGPNNDNIDPESCDGVLIEGCRLHSGDDCISLKSGRDRDGRTLAVPCQNVVIRDCRFADGHGGVALGSEAAGGIRRMVIRDNRFDSPNLTYALRLKTNARRGGTMEQLWFCRCDIRQVSGAAIHGTMMYEDGSAGDFRPCFRDIVIEDVQSRGGDYGIFLEAREDSPITGLTVRRVKITDVAEPLHAKNWADAVLEDVTINGLAYPRPTRVHITGVPFPGGEVAAAAVCVAENGDWTARWTLDGAALPDGPRLLLPPDAAGKWLTLSVEDARGTTVSARGYRVLAQAPEVAAEPGSPHSAEAYALRCRGILPEQEQDPQALCRSREIAAMVFRLWYPQLVCTPEQQLAKLCEKGFFSETLLQEDRPVTREELATIAMQASGLRYRNASTTLPTCADAAKIDMAHATQVARALALGLMAPADEHDFRPRAPVRWAEVIAVLSRIVTLAGI